MIRCEASLDVARTKSDVSAFLDDFSQAPTWLAMCARLEQTSPAPRRVGSTLRYSSKAGGRIKPMNGTVTAYEPGRQLAMTFTDRHFQVAVSYRLETAGAATRFTHTIEIETLSFPMKLTTPVIRAGTRRQLARDTQTVKERLSARA